MRSRILCVEPAPARLRALVGSFVAPGCVVEGIGDFEQALAAVAAEPARFGLVVFGGVLPPDASERCAEQLAGAGFRGGIAVHAPGFRPVAQNQS